MASAPHSPAAFLCGRSVQCLPARAPPVLAIWFFLSCICKHVCPQGSPHPIQLRCPGAAHVCARHRRVKGHRDKCQRAGTGVGAVIFSLGGALGFLSLFF